MKLNLPFTSVFFFIPLFTFTSCDETENNSFTISTSVIPQYTSYIDLEPDRSSYRYGDTVRVVARGGGRFSFDRWEKGIPEDAPNPYNELVVTSDTTITASFIAGYVSDRPMLRPRSNIFYEESPRDLVFILHENRHRFLGVEYEGEAVSHHVLPFEDLPETEKMPDSRMVTIPADEVRRLGTGIHQLTFLFEEAAGIDVSVEAIAVDEGQCHDMNIIQFYVDHGDAVLIDLPGGETLLMDTGTRAYAERYVVPFLKQHLPLDERGNQRIDHVFISHWHYDHFQGLGALLEEFEIGSVRYNLAAPPNYYGDYDDFDDPDDPYGYGIDADGNPTGFRPEHSDDFFVGNQFELGGTEITVLNAADYRNYEPYRFIDYIHRNERSLVIRMEYNNFVYTAGGDIYQGAQQAIMEHFEHKFLRSHVYQGNHHFHGGILGEHLLTVDPVLFLVSANAAAYDRDAYARVVLNDVIPELERTEGRFRDNLLSFETGHSVVRIDSNKDWTDEASEPVYDTWFLNTLYDYEYHVPYLWATD